MSKDPRTRDLGTVKKQLASKLWETSKKGEFIPNLPGIKVGDKVKLVKGQYEVNGGKKEEEDEMTPVDAGELGKELAEEKAKVAKLQTEVNTLKARLTKLEKAVKSDDGGDAPVIVPE